MKSTTASYSSQWFLSLTVVTWVQRQEAVRVVGNLDERCSQKCWSPSEFWVIRNYERSNVPWCEFTENFLPSFTVIGGLIFFALSLPYSSLIFFHSFYFNHHKLLLLCKAQDTFCKIKNKTWLKFLHPIIILYISVHLFSFFNSIKDVRNVKLFK